MNKILNILLILVILTYLGYRFYLMPKFSNGAEVPDFSAQLIDGSSFSLSDLRGNYILLDFWGSWCGPCRKDNPNLVALNKELKGKKFEDAEGFHIVSVAVERSEKSWKRAIQQDQLDWDHHILQTDLFKSEIPRMYGVNEIPTKYLLNPDGRIIAVNPDNKEVKKRIGKTID